MAQRKQCRHDPMCRARDPSPVVDIQWQTLQCRDLGHQNPHYQWIDSGTAGGEGLRVSPDRKWMFEQGVKNGAMFQPRDGWSPTLLQRARRAIPAYVQKYPDAAADAPGNIVEMILEDYAPSSGSTLPQAPVFHHEKEVFRFFKMGWKEPWERTE